MSIYQKLMEIQTKLKAPKGQYNSFGKYSYRNCEDILEALKPLLLEQKCIVTLSDEVVQIGSRYYVKATATLTDAEGEAASISNTAYAREEDTKKGMDGSQITGASSSYARKYALNGLFGIDDTKDSDTTNSNGNSTSKGQQNNKQQKIDGKAVEEIKMLAAEVGQDIDQICVAYKVAKLADMTPKQYENCIGVLRKKLG